MSNEHDILTVERESRERSRSEKIERALWSCLAPIETIAKAVALGCGAYALLKLGGALQFWAESSMFLLQLQLRGMGL